MVLCRQRRIVRLHRGVEFGVAYKPIYDLNIRSTGSYSIHKYNNFVVDPIKNIDYIGNHMVQAPEWVVNSEITYSPSWFKGFRVGAEW